MAEEKLKVELFMVEGGIAYHNLAAEESSQKTSCQALAPFHDMQAVL